MSNKIYRYFIWETCLLKKFFLHLFLSSVLTSVYQYTPNSQFSLNSNCLPFQMVLNKRRHGADLHSIRVVSRVFKQTVVGIKQLLRQKEEELSGRAAVI